MKREFKTFQGARFKVDLKSFLAHHDIVYEVPPRIWQDGFPIGNGQMGALVYQPEGMEFGITKQDVWDRRIFPCELLPHRKVMEGLRSKDERLWEKLNEECVLSQAPYPNPKPCGKLRIGIEKGNDALPPEATISSAQQRLSLHDAVVIAEYETNVKRTRINSFIDAHSNMMVARCEDDWLSLYRGTLTQTIELHRGADPILGTEPTVGFDHKHFWIEYLFPDGFKYVMLATVDSLAYEIKKKDRYTASALLNLDYSDGKPKQYTIFLTVVTSGETKDPLQKAKESVDAACARGYQAILSEHGKWWHDFWSKSFIELDDDFIENLWYFQLYQFASSSQGKIAPGLQGLWYLRDESGWHGDYHGDINMVMSYWPIFSSNHLELGEPYFETFHRMLPTVKEQTWELYNIDGAKYPIATIIDSGREITPTYYRYIQCSSGFYAQLYWWGYLYTQDKKFLKERAYPVMKECTKFYQGYLSIDEQGKYYIYPSWSPEQGPLFSQNPTIDIVLIKALLKGTIEASKILSVDEKERQGWQKILDNLPEYPTKDNMFLDSASVDTHISLNHPSLLAPVFPAGEIGIHSPQWSIAANTLNHIMGWAKRRSFVNEDSWNDCFTWPWLACVAARLGLGDKASEFLYNLGVNQFLKPNGFFSLWACGILTDKEKRREVIVDKGFGVWASTTREGRERQPVFLESGSGFINAIDEMLLQSYDGVIRLFAAIPASWKRVRVAGIRAVGGFLVCSEFNREEIGYVSVESLAGCKCQVVNPWPDQGIRVRDLTAKEEVEFEKHAGKVIFDTLKGHLYILERVKQPMDSFPVKAITGRKRLKPRKWFNHKGQAIYLGKPR
ncbi:MAG: glycoside hydrolase N-terminal domain-containing protein [Candidatus Latescibacteria bacterium]|nr:glycoside hydrolase N-terminal domain-containing protein [Candidatus Latescibacterota bacterium]